MAFADSDLDFVFSLVAEAAVQEIVPRFRQLEHDDIQEKKSAIDLVTDADLLAEQHITEALLRRFPGSLVIGEEAVGSNPGLLDGLRDAELAFVIDPVDGTFNFASGNPLFGSMLAVVAKGETVAGIIHDPLNGDTLVASKGAGARVVGKAGGSTVARVAEPAAISATVGTISCHDLPFGPRSAIMSNLAKTRLMFAYNCSAFEYWMMATGRVHFIGHFATNPWDHLAGVLIHAEAGGYTAKHDGSPYLPGDRTGGILSAPSRDMWQDVAKEILGL